jgi:predicted adenine nucleotide alpha hydrolase (AANH) superfamily ATPase
MSKSFSEKKDPQLMLPPGGTEKVLLHSCCAPCSGGIMERLVEAGMAVTVFFCNPNIHPQTEYLKRKEENQAFAEKLGLPFIDADYRLVPWFSRIIGLEQEPERGRRCAACFAFRLEQAADQTAQLGIPVFATTLGISRWKDLDQVNACGRKAAEQVSGVDYWEINWRKGGGSQRMTEVSRREGFYQQEYCGCLYSLRAANQWRREKGREVITPEPLERPGYAAELDC